MFGGRFSLTGFSLRERIEKDLRIQANFTEIIGVLISSGQNIGIQHNFREVINTETTLTAGIRFAHTFGETFGAENTAVANYRFSHSFRENISAETFAGCDISIKKDFEESIDMQIFAGMNISYHHDFGENINANVSMGENISFGANFREGIFGVLNAGIIDEDMLVIDVTIPPGGELRIDSENFTVTLNGESILHLHEGSWVNISRSTIDIIALPDGTLNGQLIYLERYL